MAVILCAIRLCANGGLGAKVPKILSSDEPPNSLSRLFGTAKRGNGVPNLICT